MQACCMNHVMNPFGILRTGDPISTLMLTLQDSGARLGLPQSKEVEALGHDLGNHSWHLQSFSFYLQYLQCPPPWLKLHGGGMTCTGTHGLEWAMDLTFRGRELIKEPQRVSISEFVPDAVFPFLSFSHFGREFKLKDMYHIGVFLFRRALATKGEG